MTLKSVAVIQLLATFFLIGIKIKWIQLSFYVLASNKARTGGGSSSSPQADKPQESELF